MVAGPGGREGGCVRQAQLAAAASRLSVNPHLLCVSVFQKLGMQLVAPRMHKRTRVSMQSTHVFGAISVSGHVFVVGGDQFVPCCFRPLALEKMINLSAKEMCTVRMCEQHLYAIRDGTRVNLMLCIDS